jgi:4-hydroxybenzoate polyprenyltransferase
MKSTEGRLMSFYKNLGVLIRPHHYIKNLFIFSPLFFALKIVEPSRLTNAAVAFVAFSLAASAIYVFNDFIDIEDDSRHPKKKKSAAGIGSHQ